MTGSTPRWPLISATAVLLCSLVALRATAQESVDALVSPPSTQDSSAPSAPAPQPVPPAYGNGAPPAVAPQMMPYPAPYVVQQEVEAPDYEGALRAQIEAKRRERGALVRAGRPPFYIAKRVVGFTAIGAGGVATALGLGWFALHALPHSEQAMTNSERIGAVSLLGGGAMFLSIGLWAVISSSHDNPYRDRIVELKREQEALARQLKQARRDRKLRLKYGAAPMYSTRGATVGLVLTVTM